jgi:hypothetical protein
MAAAETAAPAARAEPRAEPRAESRPGAPGAEDEIGRAGERLTRQEAFDLVRRSVARLTRGDDDAARASAVRESARALLGRDSESLSERNFVRILKDAHDANIVDLRRRGDDFEVARAAAAPSVADQLAEREGEALAAAAASQPAAPPVPRGMGHRGATPRGRGLRGARPSGPPPDLLSIGIVDEPVAAPRAAEPAAEPPAVEETRPAAKRGRAKKAAPAAGRGRAKSAAKAPAAAEPAKKSAAKKRARKTAASGAAGE